MHSLLCTQIENLVMRSARNLDDLLADLLLTNGGREDLSEEIQTYEIVNFNGFSGFNYWIENELIGQIHLGNLLTGGFVLYKRIYKDGFITEKYDIFDGNGEYNQTLNIMNQALVTYNLITMEIGSPILNHFYNILHLEYERAITGSIHTREILFMEKFLDKMKLNPSASIGVNKLHKDLALQNINYEIHRYEEDPVLRWQERQEIFRKLKEIRQKVIDTKKRAHHMSYLKYNLPIYFSDFKTSWELIKKRPSSNIRGLLYKYTLGNFLWFLKTVKDNLGYSVALAIYGPFTFYFITQPMNPHAMWAVGKVRDAYISMVNSVESIGDNLSVSDDNHSVIAQTADQADSVSVKAAAVETKLTIPEAKESWEDRMSKFKAMQIGYEGNMVFAARLGRIEQLENQYTFPLTVDSLWQELKRYENGLKSALAFNTNLDHRFKSFVNNELTRITEYKFWALERLSQFFLDHPYIAVDQNNEQTQKDVYTSRGFVLLKEMATELSELSKTRSLPATHQKIIELAAQYKNEKKADPTILGSLKKNSKLFASKDIFDTENFRSYMKRHWEILFLQQNKKQEASSFGLQSYTWSARNALWIMQTIVSAKREELPALTYKFNLNNQGTEGVVADSATTGLYESMLEFMVVEFTGVKKEIAQNMNDKEIERRKDIINMVSKSFDERDGLYSLKLKYNGNKTASNHQGNL